MSDLYCEIGEEPEPTMPPVRAYLRSASYCPVCGIRHSATAHAWDRQQALTKARARLRRQDQLCERRT